MQSPLKARGTLTVAAPDDASNARVMAFQLSRSLQALRGRDIVVGEDRVTFRGALLRVVYNWSLLGPVDTCTVVLRNAPDVVEVQYELRLVELPVLSFGLSCVMAAPTLLFGEFGTFATAFIVFCTFFGGIHYLLTQWRFQRFIRKMLRRANRRTMPPS